MRETWKQYARRVRVAWLVLSGKLPSEPGALTVEILTAVAHELVKQNTRLEEQVRATRLDSSIDWELYEKNMAASGMNPYRGGSKR